MMAWPESRDSRARRTTEYFGIHSPSFLVIDIARSRVAGIVDEHIDRRRGSPDIVEQRGYLLTIHEIGLADSSAGIFFYFFEGVLRAFLVSAVVHEHVGALAGEGDGDRLA